MLGGVLEKRVLMREVGMNERGQGGALNADSGGTAAVHASNFTCANGNAIHVAPPPQSYACVKM